VKAYLIDSSVAKVSRRALSTKSMSRPNLWFVTGYADAEGCFSRGGGVRRSKTRLGSAANLIFEIGVANNLANFTFLESLIVFSEVIKYI
jgi:hypothetical protein